VGWWGGARTRPIERRHGRLFRLSLRSRSHIDKAGDKPLRFKAWGILRKTSKSVIHIMQPPCRDVTYDKAREWMLLGIRMDQDSIQSAFSSLGISVGMKRLWHSTMLSLWILPFLSVYTEQTQAARIVNVDTTSGPVTGFTDDVTPGVAQFLNIPYAEPPSGPRRWLPPRPKSRTSGINATAFGNSCPQFPGNKTTVWSADAPQFGTPATPMGEDCLSVSIWAPEKSLQGEELVPVVAWLYGGSFQSGGSNVPYQNPSKWVARSQGHIVVAIK